MSVELHKLKGPALLLAGPGTGKTQALAKRIKFLVEDSKVPPGQITVITFTAPAASNMHDRISDSSRPDTYIDLDLHPDRISTMHSLGHSIIKEKVSDLGLLDNIAVLFSDDLKNIIAADAAQLEGFARKDGKEAMQCRQIGRCAPSTDKKCKICALYKSILRSCSAIDHDDQILLACEVLRKHADICDKYKTQCKHLLVDEYQDINAGQFELIKLLTEGQTEGLFVVGDDDQSIYSWRGGSPEFIRTFKAHFGKDATVEALRKSFRCRPPVLEGAIAVVTKYDKDRLDKGTLDYEHKSGHKIVIHNVPSDAKEAIAVRQVVEKTLPPRRVLVLIPNKYFSTALISEMRKANIKFAAPTRLPGEGLPLIATLREWLMNNGDSMALRECIEACIENSRSGIPSRRAKKPDKIKLRDDALQAVSQLWIPLLEDKSGNLWEALSQKKDENKLYATLFSIFDEFKKFYEVDNTPADFMSKVITQLEPWKTVCSLLDEIDSWVETSEKASGSGKGRNVALMTFQGAKGLEAEVVCVIGLEEGNLPQPTSSAEHLAEQSRLMFVTMTRAKEELHLFHARTRSAGVVLRPVHRKGMLPDIKPSQFLDVIPAEHKETRYHRA